MNNFDGFYRAKHVSEVLFSNCLREDNEHFIYSMNKEVKFMNIVHIACEYNADDGDCCASKVLDCQYHVDIQAHGSWIDSSCKEKLTTFHFDVEDVDDKNISTGNYTVPKTKIEFFEKITDSYYLAFRCNDGKKRLDKYIVVNVKELCANKSSFKDNGDYFLVPSQTLNAFVDKFEVESDF